MDRCTRCLDDGLITMELASGDTPIRYCFCTRCGQRWWTDVRAGAELSVPDLLALVAVA